MADRATRAYAKNSRKIPARAIDKVAASIQVAIGGTTLVHATHTFPSRNPVVAGSSNPG